MICRHCKEVIEVGEACIPEAINGSTHYSFFHPSCHARYKAEREEQRLEDVADQARVVH